MLTQLCFRFLVGGLFVSGFALLGTIFRPKSFAGLFGPPPPLAPPPLALTIKDDGRVYAATEAHSMLAGAAAFFVYAWLSMFLLHRYKPPTTIVTSALLLVWLAVAMTLWFFLLKGVA